MVTRIDELYPRPRKAEGVAGYLRYTLDQWRMAQRRGQYLAGLSWAVIELTQYGRDPHWVLGRASADPDYERGVKEALGLICVCS